MASADAGGGADSAVPESSATRCGSTDPDRCADSGSMADVDADAGRGGAVSDGHTESGSLATSIAIGANDGSGWGASPATTIVRGHITWERVEIGGDVTVADSIGNGFQVLAIVNNPDDCTPLGQIDPATWAEGVVSQIKANPGMRFAEAGNEMYLKGTTGNGCAGSTQYADPQHYGAMYLAAIQAMSTAGVAMPLLFNMTGDYNTAKGWSQDANGGGWLRDAVNANPGLGAAILANGVTTHPYGGIGQNTDGDSSGTGAVAAQEAVAKTVLGGIPAFYITEFGFDLSRCGTPSGACSQADQANEMQEAYDVFLADPHVKGIWWYQSHDDSSGSWGFMNNDNSTRPSFDTLSAIAKSQGQ